MLGDHFMIRRVDGSAAGRTHGVQNSFRVNVLRGGHGRGRNTVDMSAWCAAHCHGAWSNRAGTFDDAPVDTLIWLFDVQRDSEAFVAYFGALPIRRHSAG